MLRSRGLPAECRIHRMGYGHRDRNWPVLNFDAPALIVCQMPVEHIHIVHGQQVDVFLDESHWEEMTRAIEVHATIGETWCVGDDDGG